jgi:hypothetical protein
MPGSREAGSTFSMLLAPQLSAGSRAHSEGWGRARVTAGGGTPRTRRTRARLTAYAAAQVSIARHRRTHSRTRFSRFRCCRRGPETLAEMFRLQPGEE